MSLGRGGDWGGGGWDTALQIFYQTHEQPNRPYQGSFLAVNPTKCCQFNSWHRYPPCWTFSASWPLVSQHQGHLKSTHALADARQATETSHGKSRLKRSGQWNGHQLLADGWSGGEKWTYLLCASKPAFVKSSHNGASLCANIREIIPFHLTYILITISIFNE